VLTTVVSLLVGGLVGWVLKRVEVGRTAKIEAGDLLAELPDYIWKRGEKESLGRLRVFLGKLRLRLRAAGVPEEVVAVVLATAEDHWCRVFDTGEVEIGYASPPEQSENLVIATELAQEWLFGTRHPVRRWRAHRDARRLLAKLWLSGYSWHEAVSEQEVERRMKRSGQYRVD
jgi:hypothetical protein